jgi:hypothetical protein
MAAQPGAEKEFSKKLPAGDGKAVVEEGGCSNDEGNQGEYPDSSKTGEKRPFSEDSVNMESLTGGENEAGFMPSFKSLNINERKDLRGNYNENIQVPSRDEGKYFSKGNEDTILKVGSQRGMKIPS